MNTKLMKDAKVVRKNGKATAMSKERKDYMKKKAGEYATRCKIALEWYDGEEWHRDGLDGMQPAEGDIVARAMRYARDMVRCGYMETCMVLVNGEEYARYNQSTRYDYTPDYFEDIEDEDGEKIGETVLIPTLF